MRKLLLLGLLSAITLATGCASAPDLSAKEGSCVRECSTTYATCIGRFRLSPPVFQQRTCMSALQVCGSACPDKSLTYKTANTGSQVDQGLEGELKKLQSMKDQGLITEDEFGTMRAKALAKYQ